MRSRYIFVVIFVCGMFVCPALFAQESSDIADLTAAVDMIWLIYAATLVFFMQAGFAMLSAGLTRAKNASNVLMKNLIDFAVGSLAFWAVGWGLMYGKDLMGIIGTGNFFLSGYASAEIDTIYRDWLFQVVFAGAAATIISGAMAERLKFRAYLIYSVVITAFIYPISGHWVWGGGWLAGAGFHDFAGSAVVHMVGGAASLVGAIAIGPRLGKYIKFEGRTLVRAIVGHNIPLAALGTFILWFGWYGFNAGSTLSGTDTSIARIAVTTTLAAGAGVVGALGTSWIMFKKPEPTMCLNGALGGLVAITAGCAVVSPTSAAIIGIIGGILVVLSVELFDKIFHVDDPVGAISVHGACGVFGTLAVGLFAQSKYGVVDFDGLFFGGGLQQFGVQALGVISIAAWTLVASAILFGILRKVKLLRVSEEEERVGLDIGEHGIESYGGFQIFSEQ